MDLTDLKTRVDRARAAMKAPLEPGETRPIMPVTAHLAEDDWKEAWKVVRLIREHHVDVFNRFPEATLVTAIIAALGELVETPSLGELAAVLREDAERAGPWLVSTSLVNLTMPRLFLEVADGVILQRAFSSNDVDDDEYNAEVNAHAEIFRTLGDYLNPPNRWLRGGPGGEAPIDTTRTAALLTIESGHAAPGPQQRPREGSLRNRGLGDPGASRRHGAAAGHRNLRAAALSPYAATRQGVREGPVDQPEAAGGRLDRALVTVSGS